MVEEVATSAPAAAPAAGGTKVFTLEECKAHRTEKDCWLIIHGKVYDVTEFLDEHPGGYDIVVSNSGKDGTEDYDEIGHSSSAHEMLEKYVIGVYAGGDAAPPAAAARRGGAAAPPSSAGAAALKALLPLLLALLAVLVALAVQRSSA